jgi:hypothetical protein
MKKRTERRLPALGVLARRVIRVILLGLMLPVIGCASMQPRMADTIAHGVTFTQDTRVPLLQDKDTFPISQQFGTLNDEHWHMILPPGHVGPYRLIVMGYTVQSGPPHSQKGLKGLRGLVCIIIDTPDDGYKTVFWLTEQNAQIIEWAGDLAVFASIDAKEVKWEMPEMPEAPTTQ